MGIIVADDPDINNIQQNIDRARQNYALALQQVHERVPSGVDLSRLIEFNEEFGTEHTMRLLEENPRRFGLSGELEADAAESLADVLSTLNHRTETLDSLFAKREDILCAADPTRMRRYCIDGRETMIDAVSGTLIFVDAPERGYPLQPVMTKDALQLDRRDYRREEPDYKDDEPSY